MFQTIYYCASHSVRASSDAHCLYVLLSSPSKTPGRPMRFNGIPSSASASMFNGWSLNSRAAKVGDVYRPLDSETSGISSSFGGFGGGGNVFEYLMRAM